MPNPFRREQDAFRMLVYFFVGAVIVIVATVASGSSGVGLAVATVLVCAGAIKLALDYRRWREENPPIDAGDGSD